MPQSAEDNAIREEQRALAVRKAYENALTRKKIVWLALKAGVDLEYLAMRYNLTSVEKANAAAGLAAHRAEKERDKQRGKA